MKKGKTAIIKGKVLTPSGECQKVLIFKDGLHRA